MDMFLSDAGEFFSSFFYMAGAALYYIYTVIAGWIEDTAKSIHLPMLPSRSKILYHKYVSGSLFLLFLVFCAYINIKTFKLFLEDKECAVEKRSRIRENTLLKLCFFGGALGGFWGMRYAKHKTRKPAFVIGISIMLIFQILVFGFICGFFGFWLYLS